MNTVWAIVTRLDDLLAVVGFFTVGKWTVLLTKKYLHWTGGLPHIRRGS